MSSQSMYMQNSTMDKHEFVKRMMRGVVCYAAVALLQFVVSSLAVGSLCFDFAQMASLFTVCEKQVHAIRQRYFRAILRQNLAFFDGNETGALTQKMTS